MNILFAPPFLGAGEGIGDGAAGSEAGMDGWLIGSLIDGEDTGGTGLDTGGVGPDIDGAGTTGSLVVDGWLGSGFILFIPY